MTPLSGPAPPAAASWKRWMRPTPWASAPTAAARLCLPTGSTSAGGPSLSSPFPSPKSNAKRPIWPLRKSICSFPGVIRIPSCWKASGGSICPIGRTACGIAAPITSPPTPRKDGRGITWSPGTMSSRARSTWSRTATPTTPPPPLTTGSARIWSPSTRRPGSPLPPAFSPASIPSWGISPGRSWTPGWRKPRSRTCCVS